MPTTRDKLIADWRGRLHAAEELLAAGPRYAWLARMRIRLFRFLLSCYAKEAWRTSPYAHRVKSKTDDVAAADSVVFDAPEAALLHGKPAKGAGKIQAVLKSVAGAQDHPPAMGPLTNGIPQDCWVTVALYDDDETPYQLAQQLEFEGLACRVRICGPNTAVDVPSAHRKQALLIIRSSQAWQRNRNGKGPMALRVADLVFVLTIMGPQIAFILVAAVGLIVTWLVGDEVNVAAFWPFFARVWGASTIAGAVVFLPVIGVLLASSGSVIFLGHRAARRLRPVWPDRGGDPARR